MEIKEFKEYGLPLTDYNAIKNEFIEELDNSYTTCLGVERDKNREYSICISVSDKKLREGFENFLNKLEKENRLFY